MKKITTTLLAAIVLCGMAHAESVYNQSYTRLLLSGGNIYMSDGTTLVSSLNDSYIATYWYSATGDPADLTPFGAGVFSDLVDFLNPNTSYDPPRGAGSLYWVSNYGERLELTLGEHLFAIRVFQASELVETFADYYYANYSTIMPPWSPFNGLLDVTNEEIEVLWNGVSSGEVGDFQFSILCGKQNGPFSDLAYSLRFNFVGGNLQAVPEPSAWLLLGVGITFLVLIRKTQKTQKNRGHKRDGKGFLSLISLCVFCISVLSVSSTSYAAPFAQTFTFKQPDGEKIELWGEGDEFYAVFEHNGYTVMFDPTTKTYYYALLSQDGKELESTGLVVGFDDPSRTKLQKHLRISTESVKEKVQTRRDL